MFETAVILGFATLVVGVAYGWRTVYLRGLVLERLLGSSVSADEQSPADSDTSQRGSSYPLSRTFRLLPWALILPVGLLLYLIASLPLPYCISLSVITGLIGSQFEYFMSVRKAAKLEAQLADAVDIMVGAVGAGAGVSDAIEAAIQETRAPLRGQLEEVLGRIRLGDQPQAVFKSLSERIPLETFLLFSSTLAVQWEVGGSLGPTLSTVGRTIRDRIDISRRIRSNTAQSQISTWILLGLTYFIAMVVYSNGPDQMREFLSTSIGSFMAAGSMLLQAVGILWMSYISRMKF